MYQNSAENEIDINECTIELGKRQVLTNDGTLASRTSFRKRLSLFGKKKTKRKK